MEKTKRPARWITLAQFACLGIIALTLFFFLRIVIWQDAQLLGEGRASLLPVLRDAGLTACLVFAEVEVLLLCTRMKQASAFSGANVRALGRVALSLAFAGGLSLVLGDPLIPLLLDGLPPVHPVIEFALLPFTLLTLAAMVRAVQLLMRRALDMQEESDLTV